MNNRLLTIYSKISSQIGIIDVGTDHGYIPIELAKSGFTGKIYASDINIGPLNSAKQNALEESVADKVDFVLSDGLKGCDKRNVDTVILAGMGGDLIARILEDAPWCKNQNYKLILQPMTRQETLRKWLLDNGFSFTDTITAEKQRFYQIICAEHKNSEKTYSESELLIGKYSDICSYERFTEYIDSHLHVAEKEISGQLRSKNPDSASINRLNAIVSELQSMKEQSYGN